MHLQLRSGGEKKLCAALTKTAEL